LTRSWVYQVLKWYELLRKNAGDEELHNGEIYGVTPQFAACVVLRKMNELSVKELQSLVSSTDQRYTYVPQQTTEILKISDSVKIAVYVLNGIFLCCFLFLMGMVIKRRHLKSIRRMSISITLTWLAGIIFCNSSNVFLRNDYFLRWFYNMGV